MEVYPTLFGEFAQLAREEGHPVLMEVRSLDCHLVSCLRYVEERQVPASTTLHFLQACRCAFNQIVVLLLLLALLKLFAIVTMFKYDMRFEHGNLVRHLTFS